MIAALLLAAAAPAQAPVPAAGGLLVVEVDNVRDAAGVVHVDLCLRTQFLKEDCGWSAQAPAQPGVTRVTLRGVPAGSYAIQAFHDANRNGAVDRNFLGLPREGVGFSRDARIRFGPPRWEDAVFAFDGRAQRQALRLRYFLGAAGPRPPR